MHAGCSGNQEGETLAIVFAIFDQRCQVQCSLYAVVSCCGFMFACIAAEHALG